MQTIPQTIAGQIYFLTFSYSLNFHPLIPYLQTDKYQGDVKLYYLNKAIRKIDIDSVSFISLYFICNTPICSELIFYMLVLAHEE